MNALASAPHSVARLITEFDSFAKQPPDVVADVMRKVSWIARINAAGYRDKGMLVKAACADLKAGQGTLYRWISSFKAENWRGLVDGRVTGGKGLPDRFKSHIAAIWDSHQRDNDDGAEVQRVLVDQWNLWRSTLDHNQAIPGYTTPPLPDPATGLPAGWSPQNIRRHRPHKAALALAKHGQKEASKFLPSVITTRVGSAVLSRLLFDDQDYDNMLADGVLALAGLPGTARPVSFNCLDFYTARHMAHHLRVIKRDGDVNRGLTGKEFNWFTVEMLMTTGYRDDSLGTELILEHGKANTWSNKDMETLNGFHSFDPAIEFLTGGKVYTNRSGKFEGPVFAGLCFAAQSTGNFRFKTWIESSFRLLRIYMQALPAPIGSFARVNKREEIYGMTQAADDMAKIIRECPDRTLAEYIAANVRREMMDVPTFATLVSAIYRAVNFSTTHSLEGWRQCRFTVPLWRRRPESEEWFPESQLPILYPDPEERKLIIRLINSDSRLTKVDLMSREEAYTLSMAADRHVIKKLQPQMIGHLLPMEWADNVTVGANHAFTLANPLWEDARETYVACWEERTGRITLDGGTRLRVYHNPFGSGRAILYTLDGSFVTQLFPTARATPFDPAAKLEQLKVRSTIKSGHEAHLRARMDDIATARQEDKEFNRELVKPALDLTRDDRRRTKTAAAAAEATSRTATGVSPGTMADYALASIESMPDTTHVDDLDF